MSMWPRSKLWRYREVSQSASQWLSVMASNFRRESNLPQVWSVVIQRNFRKVACWLGWQDLRIQLSPKLDSWGTLVCHQSLSHLHLELSRSCLQPNQLSRLILQTKSLKSPLKSSKSHKTHRIQLNEFNHLKPHHSHRHNPTLLTPKSKSSRKTQPTTMNSHSNNHPKTTMSKSQLRLWFSMYKLLKIWQLLDLSFWLSHF